MKCTIPEISWHNREPVLSVDIFPENKDFYRLASGGGDCHVLIWQMSIAENGAVNQEVISDLTRHQKAVNCVRWSYSGQYLASGDDDANIIIWQLKTDNIPLLEGDTGDKEIWIVYKVLRGHKEDVYDLCWSIDGMKILSGSVDNTAILWDVNKGKMDHILGDHKGFVQGVSWDPKNQIIATISTDRICRIFDPCGKHVKARIHKGKLLVSETHYLYDKEVKFFHDDTFKSFFRRLQFSPDGSLLIVPSGHMEADNCKNALNATLIFTLDNFSSPAVILPLPHQSSTVVRCCPTLFELHEDGSDPIMKLPYRMIFAVGTDHDIILYDTQQVLPFARFQDIHYTRLTDLTWSQDGLLLIASSTDGFCSLITFEMDELGVPWTKMESEGEENPLEISGCEELQVKDENVDINNKDISVEDKAKVKEDPKEETKKRPSFLEQWALQKPKKTKFKLEETKPTNANEIIEVLDSPEKKHPSGVDSCGKMDVEESTKQSKKDVPVNRLIPRRIKPLKVEESTSKTIDKKDLCKPEEKINILVPRRVESKLSEPMPSTSKRKVEASSSDEAAVEESEDEKDSSDSEAENLSKEELEELHKASENIREFFCRVPKRREYNSDVKAIAVRRKPRENERDGTNGGNKAISTVTVNKHSDAKPIEVRRKPRDQDQSKSEAQSNSVAKNCSDAKPIEVGRKPRHQETDHLKSEGKEDSEAKNYSDAKPIEVRRKPRDQDQSKSEAESNSVAKNCSDAKPIEVRRKPRHQETDHLKSEGKEDSEANNYSDAKPIEVRRKPRDQKTVQPKSEEAVSVAKNKSETAVKRKLSEVEGATSTSSNSEKIDKACGRNKEETVRIDDNIKNKTVAIEEKAATNKSSQHVISKVDLVIEQYSTTPKKSKSSKKATEDNVPPKMKVSSLVKRKSTDKTPKKTNALLNFLQISVEKKSKKPKGGKEEVHIALSPEESEARDAWKCDGKQGIGQNRTKEDIKDIIVVDDDKTEDFCLQLEDSQEGCDEEKAEKDQTKSAKNSQEPEGAHKDDKCSSTNTNIPKTPRRVPLITLASPKSRTKNE